MAKRRVNMRFVGIGLVILMAVGVVAAVLVRVVLRPSPDKLRVQAKAQMDAGEWDEAVKTIGRAIKYTRKPDPTLWIALGDASMHLTSKDQQAFGQVLSAWGQAVEINPRDVSVLRRRAQLYRDLMEIEPLGPQGYDHIRREIAGKLLEAAPDDPLGTYVMGAATIEQWMRGVETDPRKVDEALELMNKVRKLDPADPDAPYSIARVKLRRAEEQMRSGNKKESARLVDEAEAVMTEAVAAQPDNAMMHLRNSMVLTQYVSQIRGRLAEKTLNTPATRSIAAPLALDRAARRTIVEPYLLKGAEESAKAAALAKPEDLRFGEIWIWRCAMIQSPNVDPEAPQEQIAAARRAGQVEADKAYAEALRKAPQDRALRIEYATMLGRMPGRTDDAIKLLSEDPPPDPRWIGARGSLLGKFKILTARSLTELKLSRIEQERDPAKREASIQEADAAYQALLARLQEYASGRSPDSMPDVLEFKGRLQLARNQLVDATQTYNRALSLYSPNDPQRYETTFQLAKIYLMTQQTGEAKRLLRDVVSSYPNLTQGRLMLASLLISEGNIKGNPPLYTDGAVTQIDEVEKQVGADNSMVIQLRLATLDPDKDKAKFDQMMKLIPESNLQEREAKAQIAIRNNRTDDAIRLLKLIRAEQPDNFQVISALASAYLKKNDRPAAIAVIDEALRAHPDNQSLALLKSRLTNPEEAREAAGKMRLAAIEKVADPVQRELAYVQYYQQQNNPDQVMQHALAAEKLAPDNPRVLNQLFSLYLAQRDWDKSGAYLERLAKMNGDQAEGQVLRVQYALAQGKRDDALEQAQRLTKIRPEFNQSWAMLGSVLQEMGRYDEAVTAYQASLERKTENTQALRGLVLSYLALNKPGQASSEKAEAGLSKKATDAKLYLELGQRIFPNDPWFKDQDQSWELRYGNVEKAIAPRELAVKEHPTDPSAWGDLALAYMNAAVTTNVQTAGTNAAANAQQVDQNKKKYLGKARDTLLQAATKFPEEPAFNIKLVEVNMQLKDYDAAEKAVLAVVGTPDMKGTSNAALGLSNFYMQVDKPQLAEKPLREYLTAHPDNVQVEVALAQLLIRQKRADEALKVLDANSDNPAVARQRIDTLVALGRVDEAAKALDAAIAAKPTSFLLVQRAQLDLSAGRFDEARQRLDQVLASSPDDLYALYMRARTNLSAPRGDVNSAINDLNRFLSLQPAAFDGRTLVADAYLRRGLPDEAIRNLEAASRLNPEDKGVRLRLLELYGASAPPRWLDAERLLKDARQTLTLASDLDLQLAEARMWSLRKDPAKALDLVKGLQQQYPDNAVVTQAYYATLLDTKDYRTVLADSDKLIKAKPDYWWLYQARAVARRRGNNDRAGALAELKAGLAVAAKNKDDAATHSLVRVLATEVSPDEAKKVLAPLAEKDVQWQIVSASIMQEAGDMDGALAVVEMVLATPNLPPRHQEQALKMAGILYLAQNPPNIPKAVGVYRQLLQLLPGDMTAMNNLASLLVEEDTATFSPSEALTYSQKVYEMAVSRGRTDELPLVMDTHAWALIESNRIDEGISMLRSAMEKKPFVDGHYHLGRAYMKKQPPDLLEAQRSLDQAWQMIQDLERDGRYPDPIMKGKVERARNEVKKASGR